MDGETRWQATSLSVFLAPNSDKAADFGDWELKVVPLIAGADGSLRPKESMAIAMFELRSSSSRWQKAIS